MNKILFLLVCVFASCTNQQLTTEPYPLEIRMDSSRRYLTPGDPFYVFLTATNSGDSTVSGFKGDFFFVDLFGDTILTYPDGSLSTSIAPGDSTDFGFVFRLNGDRGLVDKIENSRKADALQMRVRVDTVLFR